MTDYPADHVDALLCVQCGYDLRGHEGDPRRCPECGTVNAVSVTADVWQRRKARRRLALGLLFSFVLFTLLNVLAFIVPDARVPMSMSSRVELFTHAEIGPIAMLCHGGFSPAWAVMNAIGVVALIIAALVRPRYRPLVVLAYLAIPWWFLLGCSVAGLAFT